MPDREGHLTRDEAFLLVGLLVADADGRRLPVEVDTLLDSLEKKNAHVGEPARRHIQKLAATIRTRGLAALIGEVSRGLPKPADRHWAFGLAVEIAFSDKLLHPSEVDQIADLGDALQLSEDDIYTISKRR